MLQGWKIQFTRLYKLVIWLLSERGLQDALHGCFDDENDLHCSKLLPGRTRTLEGTRITPCHQVVSWIWVVGERS